jgi:hypothetical protein
LLYEELYDADRYFFPLLIPAALFVGFAADRLRTNSVAWTRPRRVGFALFLAGACAAELLAHRSALLMRFPREVFDAHERRFSQLKLLAERLNDAARRLPPGHPPIHFPDSNIWFPDVHNGRISTRLLLAVINRHSTPRLQLGGPTVGPEDARLLNPVLEAWARGIGEPLPYLSIESGSLVNARETGMANFRNDACEQTVISGFSPWEGSSRWMGPRGELRLVMTSPRLVLLFASPMTAIRRVHPDWTSIDVRVTVVDEGAGYTFPAGIVRVSQDGIQTYRLESWDLPRRLGYGRRVHLVLESERSWRPIEVVAGSADSRQLTVRVFAAGFER